MFSLISKTYWSTLF